MVRRSETLKCLYHIFILQIKSHVCPTTGKSLPRPLPWPPLPPDRGSAALLPACCSRFCPFTQIYNYINHPDHHAVKPHLRLECRWAPNANRRYCIVYSAAHSHAKHPKLFPQPYLSEAET
jgi:hypothetical protein